MHYTFDWQVFRQVINTLAFDSVFVALAYWLYKAARR